MVHPVDLASTLQRQLVNASHTQVHIISNAAECISFSSLYAPQINSLYSTFLQAPCHQSFTPPPAPSQSFSRPTRVSRTLAYGLSRLAYFKEDRAVAARDAAKTSSFCMLPVEKLKEREVMMDMFRNGLEQAYVPLNPDGSIKRLWVLKILLRR